PVSLPHRAPFSDVLQVRIECFSNTVTDKVEAEHTEEDRDTWEGRYPGRGRHQAAPGAEDRSPGGLRRLRAQPEEAQPRLDQYGVGDAERCLHDDRRQAVRQDGLHHDVAV